jgi:glucokinase
MTSWRIVCDAGGTNVRMARCEAGRLDHVRIVHTSPGLDIAALLSGYAATFSDRAALAGAMIAAAGPVMDEHVKLTNADVTIHASSVREALHRPVRVLNDLEAVAWALPHLTGADIRAISACEMPLAGSKLAVNIGTGFGASLLIDTPHGAHVCALEPGHMKLAAAGLPGEITATLSIEEVLSGLALSDSATAAQFWRWSGAREAGLDLFSRAHESEDGRRFISAFSALFGQVCGDLVLATGAWGGVYTTGSVAAAWARGGDVEAFRAAFCDKGPMSARMARVPVQHITLDHPALTGLGVAPLY